MARLSPTLATAALVVVTAACNRAPTPGLARGKALFTTCAPCHGALGAGNQNLAAPAIAGLPGWYVPAQLEGFQVAHRGYMPFDTTGMRMKSISWTLDDSTDAASVAEYVASLAATLHAFSGATCNHTNAFSGGYVARLWRRNVQSYKRLFWRPRCPLVAAKRSITQTPFLAATLLACGGATCNHINAFLGGHVARL